MVKRILVVLSGVIFLMTSCTEECVYWMEGTKCQDEVRTRYYGSYSGYLSESLLTNSFVNDPSNVDVSLAEFPGDPKKLYLNDGGFFLQLFVILDSENSFYVPDQPFNPETVLDSANVSGTGHFTGSGLSYQLIVTGPHPAIPTATIQDTIRYSGTN
jgi:hypothetical protein